MSKNKREDAAKKRVREKTEPLKLSDAPGQKPEKPETPGRFRDLFEDMWGDFDNPQYSKRDRAGFFRPMRGITNWRDAASNHGAVWVKLDIAPPGA